MGGQAMGRGPGPAAMGDGWRERVIPISSSRSFGTAEFGPPDGFPILWFHGTPGARRQVPPAAIEHAHRRGVRIIGVERPGVGHSTPHHYQHVIEFGTDIRVFTDRLELRQIGLIGLSGGGPYVLATCSALPDRVVAAAILGGVGPSTGPERVHSGGVIRALAYVRGPLTPLREPAAFAMTLALRAVSPIADRVFDLYVRHGPRSDRAVLVRPEMREMLIDDLITSGRQSFRAVAYDAVLFSRAWGFDIADIQTPVYLWHGDDDLVIPLDHGVRMDELLPRSRLVVVPGQGHLGMLDKAEEAIDLILSHVDEARESTDGHDRRKS